MSMRLFPFSCVHAILISLYFTAYSTPAYAHPLNAQSALLMDLDRIEIIYTQNAHHKIAPASLTKIMTMYVVFDAIKNKELSLHTQVRVSKKAALSAGSSMNLTQGEFVTVKKLLYGMAVASGNDACIAIAEHMSGSEYNFVKRMNAKATRLNMKDTAFKNSSGLPAKGQYTTANDLLTLSRNYIMIHPHSLMYHSTRTMTHRKKKLYSQHPQLGKYQGTDGLKTGWTNAGYNIISTSRRGKTRLIAIILGAENEQIRGKEIKRLMDAGFKYRTGKSKSMESALTIH